MHGSSSVYNCFCLFASLFTFTLIQMGFCEKRDLEDEQLIQICQARVLSIKRVLTANSDIFKTKENGIKTPQY